MIMIRYVIYGLIGMLLEIFWTGFGSLLNGDLTLSSHTYLWMFFIYGLGVFFEAIHNRIRNINILIRGFIWALLIFIIEFTAGLLLDLVIGCCPWDYSKATTFTILGYIRLDYFPVWFTVGLFFEQFHDRIRTKLHIN